MMKVELSRFPGGKTRALTMSYDDGSMHDRKLVEIFDRYGIKGTFHLNSGWLGRQGTIAAEEVAELYANHEVSVHSVNHPCLADVPKERLALEILQDRQSLEELVKYPVRGMSYPNGSYNAEVVRHLPAYGIVYARTGESHRGFRLPEHFLQWGATAHHDDRLMELAEQFIQLPKWIWHGIGLMYIWGHSYEFERNRNWHLIESFCEKMSRENDIWFATNIEVYDYLQAMRGLQFTVQQDVVRNPSAIPVWICVDGTPVEIPPGRICAVSSLV